jgi:hypothetical protein
MKKNSFILTMLGMTLVLGGCASIMPPHYGQIENYPRSNGYKQIDSPVPDEELVTLRLGSSLTLRQIGPGTWREGSFAGGSILKISPGERRLRFHYYTSSSTTSGNWTTTTSHTADPEITYTFEPGRIYRVTAETQRTSEGNMVYIDIEELDGLPPLFGARLGLIPGWLLSADSNVPFAGIFAFAQMGVETVHGDSPAEFLAEGSIGAGYRPWTDFPDAEPGLDAGLQLGGTVNFFLGKSEKRSGFGLGGGVVLSMAEGRNAHIPYVRASYFPAGVDWHVRLFTDYYFTQEDPLKRFGLGVALFAN